MDYVIGVDLGGTKIDIGLIAPDNRVVARERIPTESERGSAHVVELIVGSVERLRAHLPPGETIAALGICTPGPVEHVEGALLTLINLPGLSNTPLRALLETRLKMPVRLEHDAKAAALGEFHYGLGQGRRGLVYITFGTGVGAAIIQDGQLVYGERNSSGEVGHITVNPAGDLCQCGTRGCLETYTSGPWLIRRYREAAASAGRVLDGEITGEQIAALAHSGDPVALSVTERAGEAIGIAVGTLAMILNIDLHVLGGSVAKLGDLLLEPARRAMPHYCFKAVGAGVQIEGTALGDDGPLLGCAWLARSVIKDN